MNELDRRIPADELALISEEDRRWLNDALVRHAGYPGLSQMWKLLDEPWETLKCSQDVMDERIAAYYAHPVWLMNGLFIEQHRESVENRRKFKDWVVRQSPSRIAELGGGFGGLARMIGEELPGVTIDLIEPHPNPIAVNRANNTPNVRYRKELTGTYDILIATDVFEHVSDPLRLVYETTQHLRIGGFYLIANCFYPVIQCHLPRNFHFRQSWELALSSMGLKPEEKVAYGRAYSRKEKMSLDKAREVESRSEKIWPKTQQLNGFLAKTITRILAAI